MFKRKISTTIKKTVSQFPVTVLTGPRQSGKTTLLQNLFEDFSYVSLESPDILLAVKDDPRGFLGQKDSNWIIDEAQKFPELFSYLQEFADRQDDNRKFILSGSQNFLLSEKISQTLAGRAAILELLPLTLEEYLSYPYQRPKLWWYLLHGSYPRPYHESIDIQLWYHSYMRTYIERDVRDIINIKDLTKFQLFLKLCAGRHGQLLNLNNLANECGISQPTANHWLSLLEASYICFRLPPYYQNFNKRLVKTPKLYFYDTALLSHLLGIESDEHLYMHTSRGAIFEGFVIAEIAKYYFANAKLQAMYFWRDQSGNEIDLIVERGDTLIAIEVKSGATFSKDFTKGIEKWSKILKNKSLKKYVVYAGDQTLDYQGCRLMPWFDTHKLVEL